LFAEVSLGRDTAVDVLESEERAAVVVGIKVGSPKCWNRGPAIHVASRDTDSDAATVLGNVLGHALDGTRVGPVAVRALTHVPPEIVVTLPARDDVDLFPAVLPHIADVEISRATVEAEAPRISQTIVPNFGRTAGQIAFWNAILPSVARINVDAQQGPQKRA